MSDTPPPQSDNPPDDPPASADPPGTPIDAAPPLSKPSAIPFDPAAIESYAVINGHDANLLGGQIDVISEPLVQPAAATSTPRQLADEMHGDWAPPPRRMLLPALLFAVTCGSTFLAGCVGWLPNFVWAEGLARLALDVTRNWQTGLIYMACVMFALLCHEMGHFLLALKHKVHASYPFFIPFPMALTGTMGAVIGMEHTKANRKQMFDIGIAGPLAGLVPTMLFVVIGIYIAQPAPFSFVGNPLVVDLLLVWLRPDLQPGEPLGLNPFFMAGWVGLLVTGLNMLPVSQLDGGHVGYALLGPRWGRSLARAFVLFVAGYFIVSGNYAWIMMYLLVVMIGVDHPPTSDDTVPLGWFRRILGFASLTIPIFCFTPLPLTF